MYLVSYRKDGSGSYVRYLFFPKIEWCKILENIGKIRFFDNIVEFVQIYAKDLLEVCTRTGNFKVSNVTFTESEFISKFPEGDYKTVFRLYDDVDLNIYNLTYTTIIVQ
jgi:hypothetical protein